MIWLINNEKSRLCNNNTSINIGSKDNILKIISWNIQGIGQKLELEEIRNMFNCYDVIFLYETMKSDTFDPQMEGYHYFHYERKYRHPRARRPSGGIAVLIKSEIFDSKAVAIEKANEHAIWLKIKGSTHEIIIGGVYIPPEGSTIYLNSRYGNDVLNELREDLACFLDRTPFVSVCGDFNSRTGDMKDFEEPVNGKNSSLITDLDTVSRIPSNMQNKWSIKHRLCRDKKVNAYGKDLINLCRASSIRIMNGFFDESITDRFTCHTPMGQSVVDYLLCSEPAFNCLQEFNIKDKLTESDHTPLSFSFNFPKLPKTNKYVNNIMQTRTFKYVFDKSKTEEYLSNFDSEIAKNTLYKLSSDIAADYDTDVVINTIYQYVTDRIQPTFKKKKSKSAKSTFPTNKWFDSECKNLRKSLNEFAKKKDLALDQNKIQYGIMHKYYKQVTQKKKRQFQENNRKEMQSLIGKNQADCWKYWKKLKSVGKIQANCPDLDTFHNYFEQQSLPPERDYFDTESMAHIVNAVQNSGYSCSSELSTYICDNVITEEEVALHFRRLKNNKAAGIDGIPAEFYKYAGEQFITPFCAVFNHIFDKGEYPTQWSEGLINALHKKGNRTDPDNYRKITINVVMGKIFDSILNSRLYFKNEALNLDDPCQFGFTPGSSTTDCVFVLDTIISYQQAMRKPVYLCFVDFTKAFDYINRNALYYKLMHQNIGDKMLKIIISMYDKAKARVNQGGNTGGSIDSKCGVLQGGILSPKLFNEFMSDLPDYLKKSDGITLGDLTLTHILYADDIVLIADSPKCLQNSINSLHNYCKKWHLIVNISKTKVMQISNKAISTFFCNGDKLENVDSFKYLGHMLTNKRRIHSKMTDYLSTQAHKALFALQGDSKQALGKIDPMLSLRMFDTYILPILEYNSEIWTSEKSMPELENLQLGYLKNILGVRKQTPSLAVYGETGRFPLHVRQKIRMVNYWIRLERAPDDSLLKKCLNLQKGIYRNAVNGNNWFNKVCHVLNSCNIEYDISNLSNFNIVNISKKVKLRLYEAEHERLINEINDSSQQPKLRTYKLFKTDCRIEPYLALQQSRKVLTKIARFRTSSHSLKIETGRHHKPIIPAPNRICEKCTSNFVEDEIHCLIVCPGNEQHRVNLFLNATKFINNFLSLDDITKFTAIMTNKEPDLLSSLGKFLLQADV